MDSCILCAQGETYVEQLTIDIPNMQGYQLHHLVHRYETNRVLTILDSLGRKSAGLDALFELRHKHLRLFELPEVSTRIKKYDYTLVYVVSGLGEELS